MSVTLKPDCSGVNLKAETAIILYKQTTGNYNCNGGAAAMIHNIDDNGNLLAGVPLDPAALYEAIVTSIHADGKGFIIPQRVLMASPSRLVWWCPAARRALFFTKKCSEECQELSGKDCNHPPLLFAASHGHLSVWALGANRRPELDDKIYQAPYFNVYETGGICQGQVRWPQFPTPASMEEYERLFFSSIGTHATSKRLTKHPDGHDGYWKANKPSKSRPTRWLMTPSQSPRTVRSVYEGTHN